MRHLIWRKPKATPNFPARNDLDVDSYPSSLALRSSLPTIPLLLGLDLQAEFCAKYLPSLVRSMSMDVEAEPRERNAKNLHLLRHLEIVRTLFDLSFLPLWKGSFLRTCIDAKDILSSIIASFIFLSVDLVRGVSPSSPVLPSTSCFLRPFGFFSFSAA